MKRLFVYTLSLVSAINVFAQSLEDISIFWINPVDTVSNKGLTLKWGIKSKSQIESVSLNINGISMKGINAVSNDGYDMVHSRLITLSPGDNNVSIQVVSRSGTSKSSRNIYLKSGDVDIESDLNSLIFKAYDNDSVAQYILGTYYLEGSHGLSTDLFEASLWFKKSAEMGYADSQYEFAISLLQARGILRNRMNAVAWLIKAADQNHPKAQYQLGLCYENGIGVAKDIAKAKKWYEICPLDEAKKRLSSLE